MVWLLTGIWHGAHWNYVLWGVYYGVILLLEKFVFGRFLKKLPGGLQSVYTLLLVVISWVIFKCEDLSLCGDYLAAMFGGAGAGFANQQTLYLLYNYAVLLVILILGKHRAAKAVGFTGAGKAGPGKLGAGAAQMCILRGCVCDFRGLSGGCNL